MATLQTVTKQIQGTQDHLHGGADQFLSVYLSGNSGSGKTALIQATLRRLAAAKRAGVVVAHLAAERDAARLRSAGALAIPLENEFPDAATLQRAVETLTAGSDRLDLLLIEHAGDQLDMFSTANSTHSACVAIFSVTGGDDKPSEFPGRVRAAELIVLTKTDLLPHVKFDTEAFCKDIRRANPHAKIIEVSSTDGSGMDAWLDWLTAKMIQLHTGPTASTTPDRAEWWFG